jgi:hypothetical protein
MRTLQAREGGKLPLEVKTSNRKANKLANSNGKERLAMEKALQAKEDEDKTVLSRHGYQLWTP